MKFSKDFGILRREGLSKLSIAAVRNEMRNVHRALAYYDEHVDRALADPRLSQASKRFLRELWYGDPRGKPLSLANRKVRRAAMMASMAVLLLHAQQDPTARRLRLRFRMLTTSPDVGITDFAAPTLSFSSVQRHFDAAARNAGVHAIAFTDIAIVDQRMDQEPLKLAIHVHGAIRASDNSFRTKAAERLASPVRVTTNQCGLRVVKISSKKKDWGPSLTRGNVTTLGYYISKITCGVDVVFTKLGRRQTKTTLRGWSLVQALRQLECYSHCDALKSARGIDAGSKLRPIWKKLLLELLRYPGTARGVTLDHGNLVRKWARIWGELGEQLQPASVA